MSEAKLHEELARATQAERELSISTGFFEQLEADYIKAWRDTSLAQERERERLWQAVQIIGKVRDHLKHVASGRKLIEKQIAELSKLGDRRKFFGVV